MVKPYTLNTVTMAHSMILLLELYMYTLQCAMDTQKAAHTHNWVSMLAGA